jgi:hypothetical protein
MSAIESLSQVIDECILNDKLACIAITSSARGKYANEGFMFGMGKSTLAYHLLFQIYKKYHSLGDHVAHELTRLNFGYTWDDMDQMFDRAYDQRVLAYCQDDFQNIAGKHQSWNKEVQKKSDIMTESRPFLALFITTQPDLGKIAKCWREVFMIEIKIPIRGFYEVQLLDTYSPFKDPLNPRVRLAYKSEGDFPDMDKETKRWYIPWRKNNANKMRVEVFNPSDNTDVEPLSPPVDLQWQMLRESGQYSGTREEYRHLIRMAAVSRGA